MKNTLIILSRNNILSTNLRKKFFLQLSQYLFFKKARNTHLQFSVGTFVWFLFIVLALNECIPSGTTVTFYDKNKLDPIQIEYKLEITAHSNCTWTVLFTGYPKERDVRFFIDTRLVTRDAAYDRDYGPTPITVFISLSTYARVLLVTKSTSGDHCFSVPDLGIKQECKLNQTSESVFSLTKPGTFFGYCSTCVEHKQKTVLFEVRFIQFPGRYFFIDSLINLK